MTAPTASRGNDDDDDDGACDSQTQTRQTQTHQHTHVRYTFPNGRNCALAHGALTRYETARER